MKARKANLHGIIGYELVQTMTDAKESVSTFSWRSLRRPSIRFDSSCRRAFAPHLQDDRPPVRFSGHEFFESQLMLVIVKRRQPDDFIGFGVKDGGRKSLRVSGIRKTKEQYSLGRESRARMVPSSRLRQHVAICAFCRRSATEDKNYVILYD